MVNPDLKAYIFPKVNVDGDIKTVVLRSKLGAQIAAGNSLLGFGYLLEGNIETVYSGNIINRMFGRKNYQDRDEFIEDVKKNFLSKEDVAEGELEEFARENKLTPTRLIFR